MLTTGPGVKNHELFVIKIFHFFKNCCVSLFSHASENLQKSLHSRTFLLSSIHASLGKVNQFVCQNCMPCLTLINRLL